MSLHEQKRALRAVCLAVVLGAVITAPATAQTNADNAPVRAERTDDGFDLGWLGLIGLVGLLGLRKKDRYDVNRGLGTTTR